MAHNVYADSSLGPASNAVHPWIQPISLFATVLITLSEGKTTENNSLILLTRAAAQVCVALGSCDAAADVQHSFLLHSNAR